MLSVGNLLFWNKAESTSKEAEREKANEIEGRSSQGGEAPPALIIIYQATTFFFFGGGNCLISGTENIDAPVLCLKSDLQSAHRVL